LSRLLLVRHGDTELNSAERYWGNTDIKLSDAGFNQAEMLRDRLVTEKIDIIYSSNLKRASTTAEIIASSHHLDIITCAELNEIDFGELEGLTFNEISHLYPQVTKLWLQRSPRLKYPNGEGFDEFNSRVIQFVDRMNKHTPQETILVVAHSGSLRLIICHLLSMDSEHWWQFHLSLASLSILETYPAGAILNLLNDVSHRR
jgi:alpha-ribazole phosphatase